MINSLSNNRTSLGLNQRDWPLYMEKVDLKRKLTVIPNNTLKFEKTKNSFKDGMVLFEGQRILSNSFNLHFQIKVEETINMEITFQNYVLNRKYHLRTNLRENLTK